MQTVNETPQDLTGSGNEPISAVRSFVKLLERIPHLCPEDKQDLKELLPFVIEGDPEDMASARVTIAEILSQNSGPLVRMELSEGPGDALADWVKFTSTRIREARKAAMLTQQELAERAGISQPHLCRLETGQHSPTSMTLEKIAKALQLPQSHFVPTQDG